jgi:hypothetical protein
MPRLQVRQPPQQLSCRRSASSSPARPACRGRHPPWPLRHSQQSRSSPMRLPPYSKRWLTRRRSSRSAAFRIVGSRFRSWSRPLSGTRSRPLPTHCRVRPPRRRGSRRASRLPCDSLGRRREPHTRPGQRRYARGQYDRRPRYRPADAAGEPARTLASGFVPVDASDSRIGSVMLALVGFALFFAFADATRSVAADVRAAGEDPDPPPDRPG